MRHVPAITGRALGYRSFQVLNYVRDEIALTGTAPSYDMICKALGISSKPKVCDIIKRLERRGLLSRVGGGRCPRNVLARKARRIMLAVD